MKTSSPIRRMQTRRSGFILPLVVILSLVLALTGMAILSLSVKARTRTIRNSHELIARSAADAGLAEALYLMNREVEKEEDPFTAPLSESPLTDLAGTEAQYQYSITGDWNTGFRVESQGLCGEAVHRVYAMLRPRGQFDYAVFGREGMSLYNGAEVRVYNDVILEPLLLVGTNSTQSGAIDLKSGVVIDGDVAVGPDGDPSDVVEMKSGAEITGQVDPMPYPQEMPMPEVPDSLLSAPYLGKISSGGTLSTSSRCSGIKLPNSNVLTIDGGVSLYVDGDIDLGNAAEIKVLPGSSLVVFLDGDLISGNGSSLNNLTEDAKALRIYGLEGCTDIELKNSSILYSAIYAPNADVIAKNSGNVVGSVIANSFTQLAKADFFYDSSLRETEPKDVCVEFRVSRWWED